MSASKAVRQRVALGLLSGVFFIWGFLTSLNSVLVPYLQQQFQLTYTSSMLIQLAFYLAPFLACLPTAALISRYGYRKTLLGGLLLIILGCLTFYPATDVFSFPMVLIAIFITAMGVASLQVVANPYVAMLGDSESAPARLSLSSAINSLGTTLAPYIGAALLFGAVGSAAEQVKLVQLPYLACALGISVIVALIARMKMPETSTEALAETPSTISIWRYRHLVFGIGTIFCYVGVEVSVGTFMLSYFSSPNLGGLTMQSAGKLVALYWAGAMIGRVAGSLLFRWIRARNILIFNALLAIVLLITAIMVSGKTGIIALIAIGLCNSIMYPVIFSLALDKLGNQAGKASALLVMAGIGGAVWPIMQALIADSSGLQSSFWVPVMGYLVIVSYGARGYKPLVAEKDHPEQLDVNFS
ncbi:MAG: sugar MFS transporter [Endozoicomonas sp.]|uniref:sugar MFS transporter n=1 Tax=Endozoicomonas sp. TaxID=1892382 RepID=UPI003D9B2052